MDKSCGIRSHRSRIIGIERDNYPWRMGHRDRGRCRSLDRRVLSIAIGLPRIGQGRHKKKARIGSERRTSGQRDHGFIPLSRCCVVWAQIKRLLGFARAALARLESFFAPQKSLESRRRDPCIFGRQGSCVPKNTTVGETPTSPFALGGMIPGRNRGMRKETEEGNWDADGKGERGHPLNIRKRLGEYR